VKEKVKVYYYLLLLQQNNRQEQKFPCKQQKLCKQSVRWEPGPKDSEQLLGSVLCHQDYQRRGAERDPTGKTLTGSVIGTTSWG